MSSRRASDASLMSLTPPPGDFSTRTRRSCPTSHRAGYERQFGLRVSARISPITRSVEPTCPQPFVAPVAISPDPSNLRFVTVRRGAVSTAAALLLFGGASLGCSSGGDKAVALPSITGTPAPSVDPSGFPKTREGAADFVRAFFFTMNLALVDGHTDRLTDWRQPSCGSCTRFEDFIRTTYAKHQKIVGGQLLVTSSVARPIEGDSTTVTAIVDETPERIVGADGQTVKSFAASNHVDNEVALVSVGGHWLVAEVTIFKGGG
jgi:hypothetical protein